jgi:hypothetical protein
MLPYKIHNAFMQTMATIVPRVLLPYLIFSLVFHEAYVKLYPRGLTMPNRYVTIVFNCAKLNKRWGIPCSPITHL